MLKRLVYLLSAVTLLLLPPLQDAAHARGGGGRGGASRGGASRMGGSRGSRGNKGKQAKVDAERAERENQDAFKRDASDDAS